jgi:GDPmannose 4,6-dehydratase
MAMALRRALVTGIGGQDGSYLAELLLDHDYEVFGVVRRGSLADYENLTGVQDQVHLIRASVLDQSALRIALEQFRPHEIYNLASVSFVPASWDEPVLTAEFAAVGVTSMLEAMRAVDPKCRFYQASSSEIFGQPLVVPQDPDTPLVPHTPYGVAKAYGHMITRSYRQRYGLHASTGILYNHESPRRPLEYLPRKVARGAAEIAAGLREELVLGDLTARRDWGYAPDYVRAMWLMLQQDEPGDYVVATGESHSVQELVETAFGYLDLDWHAHVRTDATLVRGPAELYNLVGDAKRTRESLSWSPSVTFEELVRLMVDAEVGNLRAENPPGTYRPAESRSGA